MSSEEVKHLVVINALNVALCFSAATLDPQKTVENCRVKHKNRRALLKTSYTLLKSLFMEMVLFIRPLIPTNSRGG